MFKNRNYNKNKNIIRIPKHVEQHNIKNDMKQQGGALLLRLNSVPPKPNINKNNNYENITNIVENNETEKISTPDQKPIKNKLDIV